MSHSPLTVRVTLRFTSSSKLVLNVLVAAVLLLTCVSDLQDYRFQHALHQEVAGRLRQHVRKAGINP